MLVEVRNTNGQEAQMAQNQYNRSGEKTKQVTAAGNRFCWCGRAQIHGKHYL